MRQLKVYQPPERINTILSGKTPAQDWPDFILRYVMPRVLMPDGWDGCWLMGGRTKKQLTGCVCFINGGWVNVRRLMYSHSHKIIAGTHYAHMKCEERRCVNPGHMDWSFSGRSPDTKMAQIQKYLERESKNKGRAYR